MCDLEIQIPFVVCFRWASFMTAKEVPKRRFRRVLFPVDWLPKTATRW